MTQKTGMPAKIENNGADGPAARLVAGVVAFSAGRPFLVMGTITLLLALSIWAATGLGVDTDSRRMLNPDLDFQARSLELRDAFPDEKTAILIAIRGENADLADGALRQIEAALDARIGPESGIESYFAPATDPFLARNGLLYLPVEDFEDRLSRISESANMLASLREDQTVPGFLAAIDQARRLAEGAEREGDLDAIYDEAATVLDAALDGQSRDFGWTAAFTGETGAVLRVMTVTPLPDYALLNPVKPALQTINATLAEIGPIPGVEVGVTGDPALRSEELRSVTAKIGLSLGLSLLFVAIVLWLALRSFGRVALGLGALVATLGLTTGFAALAVGSLNLISIAFIVLMVGLGIDFAIHFLAHLDERTRQGEGALIRTGHTLGPALLLTAGSTALAFFAFMTTDFIGMAQLGLIGGVGVIIAFLVSITLIPAAVAFRPGLAFGAPRGRIPKVGAGKILTWLAFATGIGAIVLATESRFDADPMSLRDPSAASVRTLGWLADDPARNPFRAAVLARSEAEAEAMSRALEVLPTVRSAVWIGDLIPGEQPEKLDLLDLAWPSLEHAASGTPEEIAESDNVTPAGLAASLSNNTGASQGALRFAAALSRYAASSDTDESALQSALFRSFGPMNDRLTAMLDMEEITRENLPEALARRYVSPEGLYKVDILPEADIRDPVLRAAFVADLAEIMPAAAGAPVQIEGASQTVSAAMIQAVAIALTGAAVMALLFLKSFTAMLAILIPVGLAGAVCMAATVLLGMPFNYANVIVLPLIIGIGVDSGIHLAMRARKDGEVFDTATPMAAFYSALTTIAAFGTLGLSDHRGTASMGILLAIGLSATVAMTFILTPPLARLAPPLKPPRPGADTKS